MAEILEAIQVALVLVLHLVSICFVELVDRLQLPLGWGAAAPTSCSVCFAPFCVTTLDGCFITFFAGACPVELLLKQRLGFFIWFLMTGTLNTRAVFFGTFTGCWFPVSPL